MYLKDISAEALISILGTGKAEARTQAECCKLLGCTRHIAGMLKALLRQILFEKRDLVLHLIHSASHPVDFQTRNAQGDKPSRFVQFPHSNILYYLFRQIARSIL